MKKTSEWNKKYLATPDGAAKKKAWLASEAGLASGRSRTERYWRKRLKVDELEAEIARLRGQNGASAPSTGELDGKV